MIREGTRYALEGRRERRRRVARHHDARIRARATEKVICCFLAVFHDFPREFGVKSHGKRTDERGGRRSTGSARSRRREEASSRAIQRSSISPSFRRARCVLTLRVLQLPPAIALPSTNPDTTTQPSNQHPTPRRIETVVFSGYEIQTWYSSPYPAEESTSAPLSTHPDKPHPAKSSSLRNSVPSPLALLDPLSQPKSINFTPGEHKKVVPIAPVRKTDAQTGVSTQRLFVCDGCFKYMVQPAALTAHKVRRAFFALYCMSTDSLVAENLSVQASARQESLSTRCSYHLGGRRR